MNTATIAGNLTHDLELRYLKDGRAVANGTVAVNRNYRDDNGEWTDSLEGYFDFTIFGKPAEYAAESLSRGQAVVVTGRLRQDRWETDDGERRAKVKIVAAEVAASTAYATVTVDTADSAHD